MMNGEWQDGALCVSTQSEQSCSSVPGLLEVSLTLHSAADQQADNVTCCTILIGQRMVTTVTMYNNS